MKQQDFTDQAYQDFKHHFICKHMPFSVRRAKPDLQKVEKPEILGDIMKDNWSTEGDKCVTGI